MKILLLGSEGMLGKALSNTFIRKDNIDLKCIDIKNAKTSIDLTNDNVLETVITSYSPDVIINAVAIVDLSYCEANPARAYAVNGRIPGIIAKVCRNSNIYFVQISTDHYYKDEFDSKHTEHAPITLLNEYARTKYIGEKLALTYKNSLVVRTNIVGFRDCEKKTFIEWAIDELKQNNELKLFNDFYTSSIHTEDFAEVLTDVIDKRPFGLINIASSEVSSKKDFIIGLSKTLFSCMPKYTEASVNSLEGLDRANSLGLDVNKVEKLLGYKMPTLQQTLDSIKKAYDERYMY